MAAKKDRDKLSGHKKCSYWERKQINQQLHVERD